jgi:hypothetical protein
MSQNNPFETLLQPSSQDTLLNDLVQEFVTGVLAGSEDTKYLQYQEDPVGFIRDILGVDLVWEVLESICNSVRDNPYTAVQSANSVGKTFISARIALWWLNTFPGNTKVITTAAPPERQIKELLWGEIKAASRMALADGAKLVGNKPGAMNIRVHDTWWAQGFTIPMTGTAEERIARFQGHHAEHLLFIVDEAHGVPPEIYEAIESCMSGGHNHVLLLSNPLAPSGPFYDSVNDPRFHTIQVSAFDHPNVIEGKEVVPGCITRDRTVERIMKWSCPLRSDETQDATCFTVPEYITEHVQSEPAIAGLDVAEMGTDANAWLVRKGHWVSEIDRWNGVDPIKTGAEATLKAKELKIDQVNSDGVGVGSSIAPHLRVNGISALGIKFSESPTIEVDEGKFKLLRDQLLWSIREWLRTDPKAMLPPDPQLAQELSVLTYEPDIRGYITVMPKRKIRKLIGRSPDALDALAFTFYVERPWKRLKFVTV